MLQSQSQNLEQVVRHAIMTVLPNSGSLQLEGHLMILDPTSHERVSLFFRDEEPMRSPSNTSTLSFPTPSKLSSSGETSPASGNSSSNRRKAANPMRVPQQETALNLSLKTSTPATQQVPATFPKVEQSLPKIEPSRELFPPHILSAAFLQHNLNLLQFQQAAAVTASLSVKSDDSGLSATSCPKSEAQVTFTDSYPALAIASPTNTSAGGKIRRKRNPLNSVTPGKARRFTCNQCSQEFPSLATLSDHTLALHGTYRCSICPTQFTQRSNLQRHALKHVGFKPFECRVCGKAYYRKDHLARHVEQTHPGVEPRAGIKVNLSASESLSYLEKMGANDVTGIESSPLPADSSSNNDNDQLPEGLEPGTIMVNPESPGQPVSFDVESSPQLLNFEPNGQESSPLSSHESEDATSPNPLLEPDAVVIQPEYPPASSEMDIDVVS